jgi:hypothetical protein
MQLVFWVVTFVVLVAGMRFMSMRLAAQKRRARAATQRVADSGMAAPHGA